MNGGSTDANSFLFKGGYDSILKPLYKNGTFKKGPDQFVPGWDNQKAGTIFDQMLVKTGNKIDAVAAANDGMAGAVVASLQKHGLKPIPLTGQDATPQGFQNIISRLADDDRLEGHACAREGRGAGSDRSCSRARSRRRPAPCRTASRRSRRTSSRRSSLTRRTGGSSTRPGFLKKSDICNGSFKKYC